MKKTTHSPITKSLRFLLSVIAKEDKRLLWMLCSCVAASVGISLMSVWLPAAAFETVEQYTSNWRVFAAAAIGYCAASVLMESMQSGRGMRQLFIGRHLLYQVFLRRLKVSYCYTESSEGQEAYEKARQVCLWGTDVRQALEGLMDLIICILSFGFFVGILGRLNPLLIFVILLLSGLNYGMVFHTQRANQQRMAEHSAEMRRYFYLINTFQNPRLGKDIRIYKMKQWLCRVMDQSLVKIQDINRYFQHNVLLNRGVEALTMLLRDGLAYGYLIWKVCRGELLVSEFVLYFGIIEQLSGFVTNCIKSFSAMQLGCDGMAAVKDYLENTPSLGSDKNTVDGTAHTGMEVQFQNVSFSYDGEHRVLDHLNLTIHAGEKTALVGLNGAGKTTLVKLLCGLYEPSEGQILINGREVPADERMAFCGVVSQEYLLLPYTTAENISFRPSSETDLDLVEDCLKKAGLYDEIIRYPEGIHTQMTKAVDENGISMSGGQQQKLLMARMLYHQNASVWLLDEPTAALDPIAESNVYAQFQKLCSERTCIYISHRLASTRFLDRIIVLADGKISEDGSHDALMALGGQYAELFEIQSQYYTEGSIENETE